MEDIVFACRVPFFFLLGGRKCCSCWTGFGFRYVKCARWGGSNQRKYSVPPGVWQSNRVFDTYRVQSALLVGIHTQQACLLGEYIDRSTWRSNITRLSTEKTQQQLGVTQQTSKRNSSMFLNNLFYYFLTIFILRKSFRNDFRKYFILLKVQQSFILRQMQVTVAVARYYKTLQKGDPTSFFSLSPYLSHFYEDDCCCPLFCLSIGYQRKGKSPSRTCHNLCDDAKTNLTESCAAPNKNFLFCLFILVNNWFYISL